jgi:hypothetical protein
LQPLSFDELKENHAEENFLKNRGKDKKNRKLGHVKVHSKLSFCLKVWHNNSMDTIIIESFSRDTLLIFSNSDDGEIENIEELEEARQTRQYFILNSDKIVRLITARPMIIPKN